ncbi:MAG: glycoside hydrolase family 3 protein, partial [Halieaceae bacterium]
MTILLAFSSCSSSSETEFAAQVDAQLAKMTLEQKVAQMIQGEIKHVTPDDVRKYGLGSVLNGGGSFPADDKYASVADWVALADTYYDASLDRSEGNAGIPIIWGTDAVHGHNNVIGATLFPHNSALGAVRDPDLIGRIGAATAREVRATGIDWMFAPTIAVATDLRWGRAYESFSSDPLVVESFAGPYVEAVQGEGVIATAKHYIGDGGTHRGTDQGDTRMSLDQLLSRHGKGYVAAIAADVKTVMASFNSWNGDKIHGNRELLTDVLRGQLGFEGFVVSDWNGIGQVSGCEDDRCAKAINAGIDMIMVPEDWEAMLHTTVAQVEAGEIPLARIDEAVSRILKVKYEMGLMARDKPSVVASRFEGAVGALEHRAIAREAVRRSLVLLKNQNGLLPLNPSGTYAVVGAGADNIGMQSGGWTISWQGTG